MKKWILYSTGAILGLASIAGISVSSVFLIKYKNLENEIQPKDTFVVINSYLSDKDLIASKHKIYKVEKNEKTLEDVMLDHPNDFKLSTPSQFGRMVNSVFGVSAIYAEDKAWWQLASPTYIIQHPEFDAKNPTIVGVLNKGIASIILTQNQIINFYKTPA